MKFATAIPRSSCPCTEIVTSPMPLIQAVGHSSTNHKSTTAIHRPIKEQQTSSFRQIKTHHSATKNTQVRFNILTSFFVVETDPYEVFDRIHQPTPKAASQSAIAKKQNNSTTPCSARRHTIDSRRLLDGSWSQRGWRRRFLPLASMSGPSAGKTAGMLMKSFDGALSRQQSQRGTKKHILALVNDAKVWSTPKALDFLGAALSSRPSSTFIQVFFVIHA